MFLHGSPHILHITASPIYLFICISVTVSYLCLFRKGLIGIGDNLRVARSKRLFLNIRLCLGASKNTMPSRKRLCMTATGGSNIPTVLWLQLSCLTWTAHVPGFPFCIPVYVPVHTATVDPEGFSHGQLNASIGYFSLNVLPMLMRRMSRRTKQLSSFCHLTPYSNIVLLISSAVCPCAVPNVALAQASNASGLSTLMK